MALFTYSRGHSRIVAANDDEEVSKSLLSDTVKDDQSCHHHDRAFRLHAAFVFLHATIAALWITIFWTFHYVDTIKQTHLHPGEGLKRLEFQPVAEALEYKTVTFEISGGGTRDDPVTEYEGPPTPEKDMKWFELINVGLLSLTPEMNATLPFPTQPASETDNTPLIQLEVFHQLHCLNSIRQIVYGTDKWFNPDDRQDQIHIDHCIDYLRQVLMCHAGVTPLTHAPRPKPYNPALTPWRPDFATPHTCRNFWAIHDWAARDGRNSSGYVMEVWPGLDPVGELREKEEEEPDRGDVKSYERA